MISSLPYRSRCRLPKAAMQHAGYQAPTRSRMRQLKTQQQIICVTRDEHILVSGDAEQVVVTQSEAKLKVVTGDINNKDIQEYILEIFEGDEFALLEKSRKLRRILDALTVKLVGADA